ncbi:probable E3 ubiquitin-protein ligase rnf217 [Phtheirospermum japonicum]|uniref:RBR-type E3 ubiquitin transferase n=1 Tax=Phtheirospermum japonicum TaxID=374723 RepID=A0A830CV79_9LAMI|nr:probable E3 ubiquitin-protein ligase rnf217 [Phtheirospermum japonicum]
METKVLEIVNIPDNSDDDDISVIPATSCPAKRGTTKSDPISVEDYRPPRKIKGVIDLSQYDDDDVKLLHCFPNTKTGKRVFQGECLISKSSAPLTFVCEICTDEKPKNAIFRVLGCNHSYCSDCIGKYVASKLQDNIIAINCPVSGCKGFLEPQYCESILPKQVLDRWGDALCEAMILDSEKFYCPFKDCSALLVDDVCGQSGAIAQSECPACNRLFCVQCKVPWHMGIVCAEFQKLNKDERSNEDIMLMNLAKSKNWMRCSKCKFYVEKSEGCLLMKCRCTYSFCYNCGAPMTEHYCTNCKH